MLCKVQPKALPTSRVQKIKPTFIITRGKSIIARASKGDEKEIVKKAMDESLQHVFYLCDYDSESHKECVAAWDEYWELEQAYFAKWEEWAKDQKDPLETFCNKYPWTTECKVYDV